MPAEAGISSCTVQFEIPAFAIILATLLPFWCRNNDDVGARIRAQQKGASMRPYKPVTRGILPH